MFGYYPGCTIRAEEKEFEGETLALLDYFGVEVEELSEWECCGAVYPLSKDEYTPLLDPARALIKSKEEGYEGIITLCSACHHVLQRANLRLNKDPEANRRVSSYLEEEIPQDVKVYHFLEIIQDVIGFDAIRENVISSLEGEKIASYYGCLLLRPYEEVGFCDSRKPEVIERTIEALGGEPVHYSYSTDCCGANLMITNKEAAIKMSKKIIDSAKSMGATRIVTSCPLCKYNLEKSMEEDLTYASLQTGLKIDYITSPLVSALNIKLDLKGGKKDAI